MINLLFNPNCAAFSEKTNKKTLNHNSIFVHLNGAGGWNLSSWKTTCLSYKVNIMAADGLMM